MISDLHSLGAAETQLSGISALAMQGAAQLVSVRRYQQVFNFQPQTLATIRQPVVQFWDTHGLQSLDSWGKEFFVLPHSVTSTTTGDLWISDCALQQVFKFDRWGNLLLSLGQPRQAGNDETCFNYPTDVAVLSNGNVLVSDGYLNSRVVCFNAQGKYLYQWGTKGGQTGEFFLPHSLCVDAQDNVYVADRENHRIQCFNQHGEFLQRWQDSLIGCPFAVALYQQYLIVLNNDYQHKKSSLVLINRSSGSLTSLFEGQLNGTHELCVDTVGNIYIADIYHQSILHCRIER